MKILETEVPEEIMVVFNKWCKLLNYPINEKSLEMFFYDCYLSYHTDEDGEVNTKEYREYHIIEIDKNIENTISINNWILFSNPFNMNESIVEIMQNKLNEIK